MIFSVVNFFFTGFSWYILPTLITGISLIFGSGSGFSASLNAPTLTASVTIFSFLAFSTLYFSSKTAAVGTLASSCLSFNLSIKETEDCLSFHFCSAISLRYLTTQESASVKG